MERHRFARLATRAAVGGHIDFRQADFSSSQWFLRLRLVLDELENQSVEDAARLQLSHTLAVLSSGRLSNESITSAVRNSHDLIRKLSRQIFCMPAEKDTERTDLTKQLAEAWANVFGNPNDPVVKREIDKAVDLLRKKREAAKNAGLRSQ